MEDFAENIKKINDLGLKCTSPSSTCLSTNSKTALADPRLPEMRVCLEADNCTAFIIWATDKYTWLHDHLNDPEADPLIFDENYQPKPAYEALYLELQK